MKRPLVSLRGVRTWHAAPAVVLVTALVAAVLAAGYVHRAVGAQQEARLRQEVAGSAEALHRRMDAYVAKLRSTAGLFHVLGRDPTQEEFARLVESFELPRYYPGVQGIGWAKALRPHEVAAHEAALRASGVEGYRVWPEGERELYTSIVQLEPLDWRNRRAIGFDMYAEPTRRAAMERARDTGEVTATGKVELVQEAGERRQVGFLVYYPVYERPPVSPEERRALLRGWVYAPFRAADLLERTLGPELTEATGLSVYDGEDVEPAALLYDTGTPGPATATTVRRVEVAGRPWTLRYAVTGAFASRTERALPWTVLAMGTAVALLLFWIVRQDARAGRRAERAAARASFLAEAGKVLASSSEYARALPGIAALAAERVAHACLVHVVEPWGPSWSVGHRDPAKVRRAAEALHGVALDTSEPLGAAAALRAGAPQVRELGARARRGGRSPLGDVARELGATAALSAPLVARGQPLGAVVLLARGRAPAFRPDDVQLAEDLARLLSAGVDASRLYRRAQDAIAARDEFLAIASHELKTPLTALLLHADGLRGALRRGQPDPALRKADVIRRNVDRLSRLVASLLDISRIGAGRLHLELEEVDLAEVAREVAGRFEEEARRTGTPLRVLADGPVVGRWDRLRLDQVLANLVENALKYGPGQPVEVSVEAAGDHRALLAVRDRGIGISEEDQRRIFQRFERAVSRRNYGGFGLGLWIVREIVEALGGMVRVESAPGEGSTFFVELAREVRDAGRARPQERSAPPPP